MFKIQKLFFVIAVLSCHALTGMNSRDLKGTFDILPSELRHLSPVHGAVWWETGLIERFYKLGDRSGSDATMKLLDMLFNETAGSFRTTQLPRNPVFHFSPRTIGRILGTLELHRGRQLLADLADKIIDVITYDKENKEIDEVKQKLRDTLKQEKPGTSDDVVAKALNKAFQKKLQEPEYKKYQELPQRLKAVKGITDTAEKMEALKLFTQALVAALAESGFFTADASLKNIKYPPLTPYAMLLSFLYCKANTKKDLQDYFDGLCEVNSKGVASAGAAEASATAAAAKASEVSLSVPKLSLDLSSRYTQEELQQALEKAQSLNQKEASMSDLEAVYESMVCALIEKLQGDLPRSITAVPVKFEKQQFKDCQEGLMRALVNVLAFDKETKKYSIDRIKARLGLQDENIQQVLKDFYAKPNNADDGATQTDAVHQGWSDVIQNRPWLIYHRVLEVGTGKVEEASEDLEGFVGFIHCTNKTGDPVSGENFNKQKLEELFPKCPVEAYGDHFKVTFAHFQATYVIVDPSRYHVFEIKPNKRNIVIFLDWVLGLKLQCHLSESDRTYDLHPLFKSFRWENYAFDSNFFAGALIKRLGWTRVFPKSSGLNAPLRFRPYENSPQEFEIELEIAHGQYRPLRLTTQLDFNNLLTACKKALSSGTSTQQFLHLNMFNLFSLNDVKKLMPEVDNSDSPMTSGVLLPFTYLLCSPMNDEERLLVMRSIYANKHWSPILSSILAGMSTRFDDTWKAFKFFMSGDITSKDALGAYTLAQHCKKRPNNDMEEEAKGLLAKLSKYDPDYQNKVLHSQKPVALE